jgi:hypothetical protein
MCKAEESGADPRGGGAPGKAPLIVFKKLTLKIGNLKNIFEIDHKF